MLALASLLPYFLAAAAASNGASFAGGTSSDVFTLTAPAADATYFPDESAVGFAGPTPTGDEPLAIATAPSAPQKWDTYPLTQPQVLLGSKPATSSSFNPARFWGNLAPWFSVDSADNGLPGASPRIPSGCELSQVHLLQRHGARYPASGDPPSTFATALHSVANSTGFKASGPLSFLTDWTYKLGAETLTPFGRQQLFDRGTSFRINYGKLLDGFTHVPVFRTLSEDRMVDSANNFAAGFFGLGTYQSSYELSIQIEAEQFNATLAPWNNCLPNGDTFFDLGNEATAKWVDVYLAGAVKRLQPYVRGLNLTTTLVYSMQNLCAFETVSLGFSEFCGLFTEQEWQGFEYSIDLNFWYADGPGNPATIAQGIGYVEELVSRLTKTPPPASFASLNSTLTGNNITFPLDEPIYFDFTHDTVIAGIIAAMNITNFNTQGPLPLTHIPKNNAYHVQHIAPFAAHLVGQVMSCPASSKNATKVPSIRWLLNDGVVPLTSIKQCAGHANKDGLCPLDAFIAGMQELVAEEDWTYDCTANYTVTVPNTIVNGKGPRP